LEILPHQNPVPDNFLWDFLSVHHIFFFVVDCQRHTTCFSGWCSGEEYRVNGAEAHNA
jgi:hypothetical protein